jgi:drug/metabolite transporter (DMT)-like permease
MSALSPAAPHPTAERDVTERRARLVASLGIIAAVSLFAGNFVGARHGLIAGIDRFDLACVRAGVPGIVLLPYLLRRGVIARVGLQRSLVLALLGGVPFFLLTVMGVSFAPASHAVVLSPAFTTLAGLLMSWVLLGRRLAGAALGGVAIMLAGLVAIAWDGLGLPGRNVWLGDVLLACSGANWGLFAVLLQRWRVDALDATAVVGVLSLPLIALWAALSTVDRSGVPAGEIAFQLLYQGLLVGTFGTLLFSRAVTVLGSATASLFPPLVPAIGTVLAAFVLGEAITQARMVGIVVVIVGMLAATLARRPAPPVSGDTASAAGGRPAA